MASNRGGVQRVLAKLKTSVEEGKYYEAHQMYRTLYFRYNAQKKYAEAIDLLYTGATTLLQYNQHTSGTDLALLLLEVLKTSSSETSSDTIDKVSKIHRMIDGECIDRPNYVQSALQWSCQGHPEFRTGHPELHQQFAVTFWHEKNYSQSRYHFLHSQDGEGCATMLIEFHIVAGFSSEVDLFIAQAVLQFLCLRNQSTAETTFRRYTQQHPQVEDGPPYVRPMLNFLWLLLLAVEGGKVAVFTILCEQYQPSIQRDPSYTDYLDRIGQVFFGMPPPKQTGQQGLLGNLLSSLLGIDEEPEDDDGPRPGPSHTNAKLSNVDLD